MPSQAPAGNRARLFSERCFSGILISVEQTPPSFLLMALQTVLRLQHPQAGKGQLELQSREDAVSVGAPGTARVPMASGKGWLQGGSSVAWEHRVRERDKAGRKGNGR